MDLLKQYLSENLLWVQLRRTDGADFWTFRYSYEFPARADGTTPSPRVVVAKFHHTASEQAGVSFCLTMTKPAIQLASELFFDEATAIAFARGIDDWITS